MRETNNPYETANVKLEFFYIGEVKPRAGPSRCGANARPKRGAPLSNDSMTSSCSVNRVTIVVERKYAVQH